MKKNNNKNIDTIKGRIPLEMRMEFLTDVQKYLNDEYDVEIGEFEAEEMFDFFCQKLGPLFYNSGVLDARKFMEQRFVEATEDMVQIELKA
ncbi:MAG TPA: DUF2164 domain-containing protein [Chitinispirillaceae bacterium]|nr:DUF2164 domain-containing protein [Chitinispirillaceae bacterium]